MPNDSSLHPPSSSKQNQAINAIRALVMDSVQKAGSGHPGAAMSMAPVTYCLWQKFLNYDPLDPTWFNRDRFILSPGHMSALLYVMLYLTDVKEALRPGGGSAISIDDLKHLRRWGSRTPGHPEYGMTTGVETTTGPLGAGCSNSVGMAIARLWLATRYNREGYPLFDHMIYTLCSDGDLMEGVSAEAASLAGHLGLGHLVWLYDCNHISIEGSTDITFTENVGQRFKAYGWEVLVVDDANDLDALNAALTAARAQQDKPTLIIIHSTIAWGAPHKAGTSSSHGSPLGPEEVAATKAALAWNHPAFETPREVFELFAEHFGRRGQQKHHAWKQLWLGYCHDFPQQAREIEHIQTQTLPDGWDRDIPSWEADPHGLSTRVSSGAALNAIAKHVPWFIGGSADLAPSTKTHIKEAGSFQPHRWHGRYDGDNIHFGVREHAMGGIVNGLTRYGLRSFGSGFLVFSDYMKSPLRLAALMKIPSLFVFTHDSIAVGEDGPTHQPIEHIAQLRATPHLTVIRPADANEVAVAWRYAMGISREAVALILSRQPVPTLDRQQLAPARGLLRGAYILVQSEQPPRVILIATGSEVARAVKAYKILETENIAARVVSMPSWEIFEAQSREYRQWVLPPSIPGRVSIEASSTLGWERYTGTDGVVIGMHDFGLCGTADQLLEHFGFGVDHIVACARQQAQRTPHAQQERV